MAGQDALRPTEAGESSIGLLVTNTLQKGAADADWFARNAVDSLPKGALEQKLSLAAKEDRQLRVKLGIDPTAPDIHLGHAVLLKKLQALSGPRARVVLIIGDYTAMVGDPCGR